MMKDGSIVGRYENLWAARVRFTKSEHVFANCAGSPYLVTSLDHPHKKARSDLQFPNDCVIHSFPAVENAENDTDSLQFPLRS
jgi:hypothetical protein